MSKYFNGDHKKYYCKESKKHLWLLGYFGGGNVNFAMFFSVAKTFSEMIGVSIDSISIGEIYRSQCVKGFKYLCSREEDQKPLESSIIVDNIWTYLR